MSAPRRQIKLTTVEAAWIAGVKPITVRAWVRRGHVRRIKRGFVDGESLADYLSNRGNREIPARDDRGRYKGRGA